MKLELIKILSLKSLEIFLSELRTTFSPFQHTHSKADITDLTDPEVNEFLQMVYPVGVIYMSISPTDPSFLFGGVWKQTEDRFLLAAGNQHEGGCWW